MKMNYSKKKPFKGTLYRELSAEIFEPLDQAEKRPQDVQEFLTNTLPVSDTAFVAQSLHKTNIGIALEINVPKKAKPRPRKTGLSQKERRLLNLYRLPKCSISFEDAIPMRRMWESYIYKFLNLDHLKHKEWYNPKNSNLWEPVSIALMKADYHGAFLKVVNSKCHSMIGLEGIVIFDTKYTFTIVGKDDLNRTIPKQSCIFEILVKKYKFKIYGKNFCMRSTERATKKIKSSFVYSL